jgi:hypothetical protein
MVKVPIRVKMDPFGNPCKALIFKPAMLAMDVPVSNAMANLPAARRDSV